MKNVLKKYLIILVVMVILCSNVLSRSIYAYNNQINQDNYFNVENSDNQYIHKVVEFMFTIYSARRIEVNNIEIDYSISMYDDKENVIAVAYIFKRDGKVDYVVYDLIMDCVSEYGIDCEQAYQYFKKNSKIYYAGALKYYQEKKCKVFDSYGEEVSKNNLNEQINKYVEFAKKKTNELYGKTSNKKGSKGIFNYSNIGNQTSEWSNSDWGYLKGIYWGSTTNTNGISGAKLSFYGASDFIALYDELDNHCGPTALTNIMVYLKWRGMNTLRSNSVFSTFDRLRILCNHSNVAGTYMSNARCAIIEYLEEMGISASLTNFNNSFKEYKKAIDNDQIILTLLRIGDWGHFVVTLGYEEYSQVYTEKYLFVTVKKTRYLRYIRVCDGWETCDQNRYVDINQYYDTYLNSAIVIND